MAKRSPLKDKAELERVIDALRKAGLPEKPPLPLPDKPSIAVLPFVNMSEDPKQEYFCDGITEEIITALSKVPQLFVIARNSSFTYKGKPVKVQKVGRELGVKYVLEGSVRKEGNNIRITAQLVDTKTGNHLWAERYDRELKDIFAIQDEITKKIITALQVELTRGEDAKRAAKGTDNLEAYLKIMEANNYFNRSSKDGNILARNIYKEVITLDSKYAQAYVMLAWTHLLDVSYGWTKSRAASMKRAHELAQKALTLDDSSSGAYIILSGIHLRKGEIKETIALRERAVSLNPNSANNTALLAVAFTRGGRYEEAIELLKKAIRLNPIPPNWYLHYLGIAYRVNGDNEKAIETFKKVINRDSDFWLSHWGLAATYGLLGREEKAQASVAELLRIRPNFHLSKMRGFIYKDKADKERCFEVLRKAGLI
jgi:adenylate cyclase